MHIPQKFQDIFHDAPVALPDKDAERLTPYLSGWPVLHDLFMKGVNEADLKRLIIMELMSARREAILYRLLTRWSGAQQDRVWAKIRETVEVVPIAKGKKRRSTNERIKVLRKAIEDLEKQK